MACISKRTQQRMAARNWKIKLECAVHQTGPKQVEQLKSAVDGIDDKFSEKENVGFMKILIPFNISFISL